MARKKITSARFSLRGWNFKTWFLGNWSTIKEILKVGIPYLIVYLATFNPVLSGALAIVGKFIIDLCEYFFKEYQ